MFPYVSVKRSSTNYCIKELGRVTLVVRDSSSLDVDYSAHRSAAPGKERGATESGNSVITFAVLMNRC